MTEAPKQKLIERKRFTGVLEQICAKLDHCSTFEVEAKDRYEQLAVRAGKAPVVERQTIKNLWVVGSYARGAAMCGDLDIVIQVVKGDGRVPRFNVRRVVRKAFGPTPNVSYHFGTPEENSSGVAFEEAQLLWTFGIDWRAALAAVIEQPDVPRFPRDTDSMPLRQEQLGDIDYIDSVLERHASNELTFRWIPYKQVELGRLRNPEALLLRRTEHWGKNTRSLLPFALQYLREHIFDDEHIAWSARGALAIEAGGIHVSIGKPTPNHFLLDTPAFTRVTLIPHTSRRGPNGAWEIRRGQGHEIELMFADTSAYLIAYCDKDEPCTFRNVKDHVSTTSLELFLDHQSAQEGLAELAESISDADDMQPAQILHVGGQHILEAISRVETVAIVRNGGLEQFDLGRWREIHRALRQND